MRVMINALAPGVNAMLFTSIDEGIETFTVLETPKVATSFGPFGTVAGVQFAAVFQSPLTGLLLQVALPAKQWPAIKHEKMTGKSLFIARSQQNWAELSR